MTKQYLFPGLLMSLLFLPGLLLAQDKYWISFTDKGDLSRYEATDILSPAALANRTQQHIALDETDYPIHSDYLARLRSLNVQPLRLSRWYNMCSARLNEPQLHQVAQLPFVKEIRPVQRLSRVAEIQDDKCPDILLTDTHERQLSMVHLNALHRAGYTGKGITIAVFDNGFRGVDTLGAFAHLFTEGRVIASRDFVDNDDDVFETCVHCRHGTNVLSILAAKIPGALMGTAPDANYILMRTEDDYSETHQEEDNWVAAAEYADSIGAHIFTTSLGYFDFDAGQTDYSVSDLDGNTAIITKAADLAGAKGILVVNSAGNEGSRGLNAPADGDLVIAVGSVDQCEQYSPFSSQGPTADGRIKPDVTAMGQQTFILLPDGNVARGSGTSFSCPVISGMLACVLQAAPGFSREEIHQALLVSADRYSQPDKFYGHGIPNALSMVNTLTGKNLEEQAYDDPFAENALLVFPNPNQGGFVLALSPETPSFPSTISIFDLSGRKVYEEFWELSAADHPLYLRGTLRPGMYEVRVQSTLNPDRRYAAKLVVF